LPHLAELVQLHRDDPFRLIGINSYDDEEAFRAGVAEHGVDWLVAFQSEEAPITRLYRVGAFPTYLVLDKQGVIRSNGPLQHEALERLVKALLAEPAEGQ
jgi:hypothetical protein